LTESQRTLHFKQCQISNSAPTLKMHHMSNSGLILKQCTQAEMHTKSSAESDIYLKTFAVN